jgi:acyl-CoA dehydrogenase
MYMAQRTIRLADGPDEVHHHVVARAEVARHDGPAPGRGESDAANVFAGP